VISGVTGEISSLSQPRMVWGGNYQSNPFLEQETNQSNKRQKQERGKNQREKRKFGQEHVRKIDVEVRIAVKGRCSVPRRHTPRQERIDSKPKGGGGGENDGGTNRGKKERDAQKKNNTNECASER